jgi:hypothetical protein
VDDNDVTHVKAVDFIRGILTVQVFFR